MRKSYRRYLLAGGVALLAASPVLADNREVAVGADGEIYAARVGTYGDLFPRGKDFDRSNSVVALDITRPDAPFERLLVPGTGGADVETSPSVLFEKDSQTVFLLCETKRSIIHPILQIIGFDGTAWTRTVEVIGNPLAAKTSAQLTITRDSFDESGPEGSTTSRHRLVLHVVWREETPAGAWVTLYSPIPIHDGRPIPWNPVFNLDDYLQDHVTETSSAPVEASLAQAPMVKTGRDERTILIAYASTTIGRLAVIEVDVLPEQLTRLADAARMHIIDLGHELYPSDLAGLAEKARMHIVDLGHAFRSDVIHAIANQVKAQILAGGNEGLEALAEKARMHIVDLGAQLSGRGLRGVNGADATAKLMETNPDDGTPEPRRPLLFQLRVVTDLPVPAVGPGAVRLFSSESGDNLIVSWAQADKVLYRNSRNDRWSDPRELRFSDNLDLAKAYEVLEQRLRNR